MSHSPANPLVNCGIRTFTQFLQVQVRWGCPKREALPLLKGNGGGERGGKERKNTFFRVDFFPREIRQHCPSILGKALSVLALKVKASFLDKHILNPSTSTSAVHSPTENPASDPLPEKNHCYSGAFYSCTSGHGWPEVPWGEMKSWNMMLLLGLLASKKREYRNKIYAKSRLSGWHKAFFLHLPECYYSSDVF